MKVSVITPTADRGPCLQGAYKLLQAQTYPHWEWLIYDTSLHPTHFSDARLSYFYQTDNLSIGEKRNRLIEKASGDIIVHFDDDDYYSFYYLQKMVDYLKEAAFFTMHSWFSYDTKTDQFFYWDTEKRGEVRYYVNALSGSRIREIELGPHLESQNEKLNKKGKTGYGFSFAYRREVITRCSFKDIDFAEDRHFYESVEEAGFPMMTLPDQIGHAVHVIHDSNTSGEFPQYRIPHFLLKDLFPQFFPYLHSVYL